MQQAWDIVPASVVSRAGLLIDRLLDLTPAAVRANMVRYKARLGIIGIGQKLSNLPEFAWLRGRRSTDGRLYDDLVGVGGTPSVPTTAITHNCVTEADTR